MKLIFFFSFIIASFRSLTDLHCHSRWYNEIGRFHLSSVTSRPISFAMLVGLKLSQRDWHTWSIYRTPSNTHISNVLLMPSLSSISSSSLSFTDISCLFFLELDDEKWDRPVSPRIAPESTSLFISSLSLSWSGKRKRSKDICHLFFKDFDRATHCRSPSTTISNFTEWWTWRVGKTRDYRRPKRQWWTVNVPFVENESIGASDECPIRCLRWRIGKSIGLSRSFERRRTSLRCDG